MKKYRLGQSRDAEEFDRESDPRREGRGHSKRRQQSAERLSTENESHDIDALLHLPDASPWAHLPEAILIQRHSQWVDLEVADRSLLRATLSGKLKGVKICCGDRVRYSPVPLESPEMVFDPKRPQAQVIAVLPRKTLLKRGGIDDREPWQLIAANADELWICAAVVDPPLRAGLLERAQVLALAAGMDLRIIVTKRDQTSQQDDLPELDALRKQGAFIHETSAIKGEGLEELIALLSSRIAVLVGHSGVGKSTLVNALHPDVDLRTGDLTRYGTGRQTTTAAKWLPLSGGGTLIDTPGIRNLSVRGFPRELLARVFPEFPAEWLEDPMALDPEDEDLNLDYPERLQSLQRLWLEMDERNPNQRGG